ncbi:hypothetical protein [Pedobacter steynii]|uniref:Uncharacterized protein n=1 Tax=Pedobacter steynii TaxID=430522 RepID=A0A1D7QN00_9SPHI|nr:hypothetical protein [Pedobacter steynii]AOM80042.1 hypothetical protein BFS30_24490 [Pedobacter steynii]
MDYQLFCYHSPTGRPNLIEALEVMECELHFRQGSIGHKKKKLASKLAATNPQLRILSHDFKEIALLQNISENEARARFDFIQIQSLDRGTNVSIVIFDTTISIDIPFKLIEQKQTHVLREVKAYLNIIMDETAYFVFDAEAERVYSAETIGSFNFNLLRSRAKMTANTDKENGRPWWKFWGKNDHNFCF